MTRVPSALVTNCVPSGNVLTTAPSGRVKVPCRFLEAGLLLGGALLSGCGGAAFLTFGAGSRAGGMEGGSLIVASVPFFAELPLSFGAFCFAFAVASSLAVRCFLGWSLFAASPVTLAVALSSAAEAVAGGETDGTVALLG